MMEEVHIIVWYDRIVAWIPDLGFVSDEIWLFPLKNKNKSKLQNITKM